MKNLNEMYVDAKVTNIWTSASGNTYYLKLKLLNTKSKKNIYITGIAPVYYTKGVSDVKIDDTLHLCLGSKTESIRGKETNRLSRITKYFVRDLHVTTKRQSNVGYLSGHIINMHMGRTSGDVEIITSKARNTSTLFHVTRKSVLNTLRNYQTNDWVCVSYSIHPRTHKNAAHDYTTVAAIDQVKRAYHINK